MKADLTVLHTQVAADMILAYAREPNTARYKQLSCVDRSVFRVALILGRIFFAYGLAIFFLLEGVYFGAKGLAERIWSPFSSKSTFANGTENVKKAVYRFFGLAISPLIPFFPERLLTPFASDTMIMRASYKKARSNFETWDKKRQKLAWEYAIEREEKIDPKFFKFLQKKDVGNIYKKLSFQLFCQQFSFQSVKRKKYEGICSLKWSVSDREICKSIQKWMRTEKGSSKRKMQSVVSLFKESLDKDYLEGSGFEFFNSKKADWFYCPSGYSSKKRGLGHANGFIFGPDLCAKIDTGPAKKSGIKFYKTTKPNKKVLEKILFRLHNDTRKRITKKKQQKIFNHAKQELGLKKVGNYSWRQKSGSCSYTSSLASVLATLACKQLSKKSYQGKVSKHSLNKALNAVLPTCRNWNLWNRHQSFKKFAQLIEEKKKKSQNLPILYLVLDCLEERDFTLLKKLVKWKPGIKKLEAGLLMPAYKGMEFSFGDFLEQLDRDFSEKKKVNTLKIPPTFRQVLLRNIRPLDEPAQ